MRLLSLEITNFRGIKSITLNPKGENFVVWGQNGSGKSAVVDAIDFLLTGRISRLAGEGAGSLSLLKHGPHVDYKPEDSYIKATVAIPGLAGSVVLERKLSNPTALIVDKKVIASIQLILAVAESGQHVLTRREILRYIMAEGGKRSQQVQELLNVREVEDTRQAFVKLSNEAAVLLRYKTNDVLKTKVELVRIAQLPTYTPEGVLDFINKNRKLLKADSISTLNSGIIQKDIILPSVKEGKQTINVSSLGDDTQHLSALLSDSNKTSLKNDDEQIMKRAKEFKTDLGLMKSYRRQELVRLGLELLDEEECPLCETKWDIQMLSDFLLEKQRSAEEASKKIGEVKGLGLKVSGVIQEIVIRLRSFGAVLLAVGLQEESKKIDHWILRFDDVIEVLQNPIDRYDFSSNESLISKLFRELKIDEKYFILLEASIRKRFPGMSPEQQAWDYLTKLTEHVRMLERLEEEEKSFGAYSERTKLMYNYLINTRDGVLVKLYDEISDRFARLYRELHGSDEGKFTAKLSPHGPTLDFEVDFYNRGKYPPHAFHSEGHQDSMGLCLYLALSEKLTSGIIDLITLDDVVMSVDSEHRRKLCQLLKTQFPDRQFLITTHDETWAKQLKTAGVVKSRNLTHLFDWTVDTGPKYELGDDDWNQIEENVKADRIHEAAWRLRHFLEYFWGTVCELLQVPIIYRPYGHYELSELLRPSVSTYLEKLKQAKAVAHSLGEKEMLKKIEKFEGNVKNAFAKTEANQWEVNASVHYNNWENFSGSDFSPVVNSFKELCSLFQCPKCNSVIKLLNDNKGSLEMRCECGTLRWNLRGKK